MKNSLTPENRIVVVATEIKCLAITQKPFEIIVTETGMKILPHIKEKKQELIFLSRS